MDVSENVMSVMGEETLEIGGLEYEVGAVGAVEISPSANNSARHFAFTFSMPSS